MTPSEPLPSPSTSKEPLTIAQPQMKRSRDFGLQEHPQLTSSEDALIEMIYATLEVLGQSMSADAITVIASDLYHLPIECVALALRRLRSSGERLSLNAILRHAGIPTGEQKEKAEAMIAWEQAREFGEKHTIIQGEVYVPSKFGKSQEKYNALSEKTKSIVRRIGGWSIFRTTPDEEMHWLQKRFLEQHELYEPMEFLAQGNPAFLELEGDVRRLGALKTIPGIPEECR